MNDTLLQFTNVSFSYDDEDSIRHYALQNASFSIKQGEFVAVLGHNGSGKSTVAKLCNALYAPTDGKVTVAGLDACVPENELEIRKTAGVVFQNPDNQIVASIVEEDVAFGPENLGIPPEKIRQRVDAALKAVGMYEYRLHETHRLSGGQKQRVAIAGIIAMQPKCIVLDEPTAMLDPKGRADIMKIVKSLNSELNMTVVFITHFMEEAAEADRIIIIDNGKIVADDTPKKVFHDKQKLSEYGLGIPDAAELNLELKKRGITIADDIITPEEFIKAFSDYCGGRK